MEAIAYFRVSTLQQGQSGLGLDAQKELVMGFLGNTPLLAAFTEVESGKRHKNRPQLLAALELCKKKKATLVIAKLDRLSRNVAFISSLMESGVDFVCCDNPHANRLMLHMLAAFAEHERDMISQRTKAALARVKTELLNGPRISLAGKVYTKLGGPKLAEARGKAAALKLLQRPADATMRLITRLRMEGDSLRAVATYLNDMGIRTPQGFRWHASTVRSVLLKERKDESTKAPNDETIPDTQNLNDPSDLGIPSVTPSNALREAMTEGKPVMQDMKQTLRMLDTFSSVGARRFDVTFLNIDGEKRGFRAHQTVMQISNSLPMLSPGLTERQNSIVVRPHADDVDLVQLDDLDAAALNRVVPAAFLTLCTSPGNHQAWVAVSGLIHAKDFARRLRKGTGADMSASGATRLAGTVNYKQKYAPSFPTVTLLSAFPGRIVSPERLNELGLVAAQEPAKAAYAAPLRASGNRSWPDYTRCVANAPLNQSKTGPDISRADFFFSLMASQRGWSTEEIATRLMELSSKAHENGPEYTRVTAENAAQANDRQRRSRA
jgi:DNA invertase Pin-like site-specific DNA recombinase